MALVRSSLVRLALRGGPRGSGSGSPSPSPIPRRSFSTAGHHNDEYETAKWEKITYLGIVTCAALAYYTLSKGHPHHEEPPAYQYLHIRNKEFPWGPDGLFERKHH